jgi:hypothetical protein
LELPSRISLTCRITTSIEAITCAIFMASEDSTRSAGPICP